MAFECFLQNKALIAAVSAGHGPGAFPAEPHGSFSALQSTADLALPETIERLARGRVRVWRVDHGPGSAADAEGGLTAEDLAEFAHITHAGSRARSLATRAALRRGLSECCGGSVPWSAWVFTRDCAGRPVLEPGQADLDFSCSHTPWASLIAISKGSRVGIDVESCQCDYDEALVAGFLSARERRQLRFLPDAARPEAFSRLWTLKEAYVKATGAGLSEDVGAIEFDAISDRVIVEPGFGTPDGLKLAAWPIASSGGRLMAALAIAKA